MLPDLVIFDLKLPDMDGWETYQRISEGKDFPAICLSAGPSPLIPAHALKMGEEHAFQKHVDYIHKPFYNDELLARVDALLNQPASVSPRLRIQTGARGYPSSYLP